MSEKAVVLPFGGKFLKKSRNKVLLNAGIYNIISNLQKGSWN